MWLRVFRPAPGRRATCLGLVAESRAARARRPRAVVYASLRRARSRLRVVRPGSMYSDVRAVFRSATPVGAAVCRRRLRVRRYILQRSPRRTPRRWFLRRSRVRDTVGLRPELFSGPPRMRCASASRTLVSRNGPTAIGPSSSIECGHVDLWTIASAATVGRATMRFRPGRDARPAATRSSRTPVSSSEYLEWWCPAQAGLVADCGRNHQAASLVDGRPHAIRLPCTSAVRVAQAAPEARLPVRVLAH